jgi:DnaK suppressor protein
MHENKLTEMKSRLLALRTELRQQSQSGAKSADVVELDQSRVGRLSRMDAMQAQAMAKASTERCQHRLRLVAAALQRIDDGEYGDCAACDQPINPKRLEVDPTAKLCIGCASRSEP